jgi:hypothetical protein
MVDAMRAMGGAAGMVLRVAAAGLVAVAMWGCASLSGSSPAAEKEAAVSTRAAARWDALIKRDYPAAYAYLSPASRDTTPLAAYEAKMGAAVVVYRAAKVDKVECEAEVCNVTLTLTYDHAKFKGVQTPLVESWIIDQGKAWFVYRG